MPIRGSDNGGSIVSAGASFDSTKTSLQELLAQAKTGRLQLPDFQRGWVWDDERIAKRIASVSVSFPVGAVMLLESGGDNVRFKTRPLAGADAASDTSSPDTLVLDGQQRLTALLQALMNGQSVETRDTKGKAVRRRFYIDMRKGLDPNVDREDAVIVVPEDGIVRRFGGGVELDVSTPEQEYAKHMFPVDRVFDSAEWRQAYSDYWNFDRDKMMLYNAFERDVIKRFEQYQVPVIQLRRETPKEAVCLVFERVNTGGVVLTVFELLTATFAADDFQLRDDWAAREKRLKDTYPVLRSLQSDDFLQAIALLVTMQRRHEAIAHGVPGDRAPGIGCKRKEILRLEVADWQSWADRVEEGFVRAARFLYGQKVFTSRDLPYRTQLVPLAAALVMLDRAGETEGARRALARWYWCGVFGELYGGATETRFARDLPEPSPTSVTVQQSRRRSVTPTSSPSDSSRSEHETRRPTRACMHCSCAMAAATSGRATRLRHRRTSRTRLTSTTSSLKRGASEQGSLARATTALSTRRRSPQPPTARLAVVHRPRMSPAFRREPASMTRPWTRFSAHIASMQVHCVQTSSGGSSSSVLRPW